MPDGPAEYATPEEDGPGGYRTMHDLAGDERPRERLLRHGPGALADAELIAIIAGSGTRGENVIDLARGLLERHGGLGGLLRADAKLLGRTRGLGPAKAARLLAAVEIARRLPRAGRDADARPRFLGPEDVFAHLRWHFQSRPREELHVFSLDSGARLLGVPTVLRGSVHSVDFRQADIFRDAIVLEASSVVIAHNHPSGRAAPSRRDIDMTRRLADTGKQLGIALNDHVIIADDAFASLRRDGLLT